MLTFHFTGVDGSMTEPEILTSGMVGKEVKLILDESWANLTKTAVFRAGDITRVVLNPGETVVIPAEVLEQPFGKLFVGIYGTNEQGDLVIPTIMAEGPMIRYGADPIEDETAKELPVWEQLQNQIGDLTGLSTMDRSNLVSAVNELCNTAEELHNDAEALSRRTDTLAQAQEFMGQPALLETAETGTLVGAVNELHSRVTELADNCIGFNTEAAQMLVDILSKGVYTTDQTEQIDALAAMFGVSVSEDLGNLTLYWDFRTGNLTDRIAGLEATASADVTLDAAGAHIPTANSYIMLPAGTDGATLAGHTAEIKFGQMALNEAASIQRLLLVCSGKQPASAGLQWTVRKCWSSKSALVTEFTDLNMFSGKTVLMKANADATLLEWYMDGQLLVTYEPTISCTHLSIGASSTGAFPLTVEYLKIYPNL